MDMKIIAKIYNDFDSKFGIPRQSGIAELESRIVFEPEYRNPDALRGIEEYSHLWLIWNFSENKGEGQCIMHNAECIMKNEGDGQGIMRGAEAQCIMQNAECIMKNEDNGQGAGCERTVQEHGWRPTVRPPRLGGNKRVGVFATRSPFRPNPIGLSSVRLLRVEKDARLGCVLVVCGADLMNGTPIYDIKPYLTFTDCHPEAVCGFADEVKDYALEVVFPEGLMERVPPAKRAGLLSLLSGDPRPQYKAGGDAEYGLAFAGLDIGFKVDAGILTVLRVEKSTQGRG